MRKSNSKIFNLFTLLCFSLLFFGTSCQRDFEAPPLSEPSYNGPSANITLAALKQKYASISTPTEITEDYVVNVFVSGNDISGNIYKQLYVQDATAAINIGVDQNSMYTSHRAGQELYINLKGLFMVKYGDELQLGFGSTNANRIAWEVFNQHVSLKGWPKEENLTPLEIDLSKLDASMVNKLVIVKNVRFVNAGKNKFTSNEATTNEAVKDLNNISLDVRTSSYSTFAADVLPVGKGTLVGLLGRFNGSWQLFLRDRTDIKDFDGQPATEVPSDPTEQIVFRETFGTGNYPSGNRPKIADFTGFDSKAPITFTDASAAADIRSISGDNGAHIWLPSNRDITLTIANIPTANAEGLTLTYQLAANLYDAGTEINLNVVKVKVNGTDYAVPSTLLTNAAGDNSKFYTVTIPNIKAGTTSTIEFKVEAAANTVGLRLDNIIIKKAGSGTGSGIVVGKD